MPGRIEIGTPDVIEMIVHPDEPRDDCVTGEVEQHLNVAGMDQAGGCLITQAVNWRPVDEVGFDPFRQFVFARVRRKRQEDDAVGIDGLK